LGGVGLLRHGLPTNNLFRKTEIRAIDLSSVLRASDGPYGD
jgi:hypothetical protein